MEDLLKAEAEREKREYEDFMREFYWDHKKKDYFDPKKKFGMIEDEEQQIYDNITTSYRLNLPAEYYH